MDKEKFCPTCGRSNALSARYCSNCGQILPAGSVLLQRPADPRPADVRAEEDTVADTSWRTHSRLNREETGDIEGNTQRSSICLRCGREQIARGFTFCTHCGADLPHSSARARYWDEARADAGPQQARTRPEAKQQAQPPGGATTGTSEPAACALLSFFFPGAGQMLCGQIAKGILLLVLAFFAARFLRLSLFSLPLLVGQVLVAIDAYCIAKRRRAGHAVDDWEWRLKDE